MSKRRKPIEWTAERVEWLETNYNKFSDRQLAERFARRFDVPCSQSQIARQRKNLGLQKIDMYGLVDFNCKQCGRHVYSPKGVKDKRRCFCSRECEKKYWRHPPEDNPATMFHFYGRPDYDLKE